MCVGKGGGCTTHRVLSKRILQEKRRVGGPKRAVEEVGGARRGAGLVETVADGEESLLG